MLIAGCQFDTSAISLKPVLVNDLLGKNRSYRSDCVNPFQVISRLPEPAHLKVMAGNSFGKAVKSVAKAVGEYQYPWRDKLEKHKNELCKGVWGYWELGAWKPLSISARQRARLRKEVLLAGEDWPYDPERKPEKTKRKGHKCDRIAAEKREKTKELMQKMPEMLLDYKKRRWAKKMKEEESRK